MIAVDDTIYRVANAAFDRMLKVPPDNLAGGGVPSFPVWPS